MINPYFCYALAFGVALIIYPLDWSNLYPSLSFALVAFLLLSILLHILAGIKFATGNGTVFRKLDTPVLFRAPVQVTIVLYVLWLAEFLYEGGVPLFNILFNRPYNYRTFGIPSLHVFIVTFSSFYTIYLFHLYLSSRRRLVLTLFAVNLFAAILIYSRAMFFFNTAACLFLFLTYRQRTPRYIRYLFVAGMVVLFYLFGVMGTLRVSREAKRPYDNTLFLKIGGASQSFVDSFIPKEYFWTYIYVTSPLANLQNNVNSFPEQRPRPGRLAEMINNEVLMDFASKRINTIFHRVREKEYTIPGPFNVSTVYSRCYSYAGWPGMFIMAIVVLVIPLVYCKLVPRESPFFLTGFVTLCTMYLFLAYDNTIRFTGLSFQLVYPVLLTFGIRKFTWISKIFSLR
jgi:hypothetical protein